MKPGGEASALHADEFRGNEMELFRGRPMLRVGAAVLLAALAGYFFNIRVKVWLALALLVCAGVFLVLFSRSRNGKYRNLCLLLAALLSLGMLVRAFFYWDVGMREAASLCGTGKNVVCQVTSVGGSAGYYSSFEVEVRQADGQSCSRKAHLTCAYASEARLGYTVEITDAEILLVTASGGDYTDSDLADGLFLEITSADPACFRILGEEDTSLRGRLSRFNEALSARLLVLLGRRTGGISAAMLLRHRADLPGAVRRDFARAGISHLLAVSGLHLSVISGLLLALLSALRVPRPAASGLVILFASAYLAVLGFPFSALRSFLMLLIVFGTRLCGFDADGANSLGIALTVILLLSPGAFLDLGFVMSFSATLGLVVFLPSVNGTGAADPLGDRAEKWFSRFPAWLAGACTRLVRVLAVAVLTVVSAEMFIALPAAAVGGELSLAAIPVNLIACPLAGLLLGLLLLFVPLSGVPYVSGFLGFCLTRVCGWLTALASHVSALRGVSVSLSDARVGAVVCAATLACAVLLIVRLRHRWLVFVPHVLGTAAAAVLLLTAASSARVDLTVLSRDENDAAVLTGGGYAVILDASDGSAGALRDAFDCAASQGAAEIEVLILTHCHVPHEASVLRMLETERVRQLWLPMPETNTERETADQLLRIAAARDSSCRVRFYAPGSENTVFGDLTLTLSGTAFLDRSAHPVFSFSLTDGEERVTYLSASAWESGNVPLPDTSDVLLLGAHGPVVRTAPGTLPACGHVVLLGEKPPAGLFAEGSALLPKIAEGTVLARAGLWKYTFHG